MEAPVGFPSRLGVVFDNLESFTQSEVGQVLGVRNEMQRLSRTLATIREVLSDAEEKQFTDWKIYYWLNTLEMAAFTADVVVDECAIEGGRQPASEMRNNSWIKQLNHSFKQVQLGWKIAKGVKKLRKRFDEIAAEMSRLAPLTREQSIARRAGFNYQDGKSSSMLSTTPLIVYGRDADKEHLVQRLLNNSQEYLSICPIVGSTGVGKTTLAQLVYNDERVAKHFEVRFWVWCTRDFDFKSLIKAILASLSGDASGIEELDDELDPLLHRLQDELRQNRFLLVLDDVTHYARSDWNKLLATLRKGVKGSSIVVTATFISELSPLGTLPYDLQPLSEDDGWSLFRQCAFGLESEGRSALVRIGRDIVRHCGGIPLAIKFLGASLRFKNMEIEWFHVRNSQIWNGRPAQTMPALILGYCQLPSDLKQCLRYCSFFPGHHKIKREELIRLWMAVGFVQPKGRMELEDVGNEIFNALLHRSFFQEIDKDEDGRTITINLMQYPYYTKSDGRLDLASSTEVTYFSRGEWSSRLALRSFIKCDFSDVGNLQDLFSSFKCIRALDLRLISVKVLPHSIGKLKHLRYLSFSQSNITSLPESICRLEKLQTLNLRGCCELQTLPADMRKMISLRHLDTWGCHQLTSMPIGIGKLTCLQTLGIFIVGTEKGCGIEELQELNLGGDLEIKGLEHVKASESANLYEKENIRSLWLSWSQSHLQENAEEVIHLLQPYWKLRRLSILGYKGVSFPRWLTASSLPNLVEISLSECSRCELLPALGILPLLKILEISSLASIKFIDDGNYTSGMNEVELFPSLEKLAVESMPNLEGWSSSHGGEGQALLFPCLKILCLSKCPKLTATQLPSSLREVSIRECSEMVSVSLQNLPCLEILCLSKCPKLTATQLPSSLREVSIRECSEMVLGSLQNLPCLFSLQIIEIDNMIHFPEGARNLTALRKLIIQSCNNLQTMPFVELYSLRSLSIEHCHCLTCLPKLEKSFLHYMYISDCPELQFSSLTFPKPDDLQTLKLIGLPKLTCLPEGMKHARSLEVLSVQSCSKDLMELPDWIGSLISLQVLRIDGCKNQKMLPERMRELRNLQTLQIRGCHPHLESRCETYRGQDWYKISNVTDLSVNSAFPE